MTEIEAELTRVAAALAAARPSLLDATLARAAILRTAPPGADGWAWLEADGDAGAAAVRLYLASVRSAR